MALDSVFYQLYNYKIKSDFLFHFDIKICFFHNNNNFSKIGTYYIIEGRKNHSRSNSDPPANYFAKPLKNRPTLICNPYTMTAEQLLNLRCSAIGSTTAIIIAGKRILVINE